MQKLILLVVGAAWAAVLLPPLLRSRTENRPSSSVSDFRRQLSSLQRTTPRYGTSPMRAMARPLAPTPGRTRSHASSTLHRGSVRSPYGTQLSRTHSSSVQQVGHRGHRQVHLERGPSPRALVVQRRRNVLMALVTVTFASLAIAVMTASDIAVYVCVLAAISLAGYCYKLVRLRQQEQWHRGRDGEDRWFWAA
jgi:hypothetical protein